MTVSVDDAQFLRSAHQSCTRHGAFKGVPTYRVSGTFRSRCNRLNGGPAAFRFRLSEQDAARRPQGQTSSGPWPTGQAKEISMLYAILAYHVESDVMSWT